MANEIPVYLFVGFLESGKTKFIQETFEDPNFDSGDKTLLLVCEEGEEEYNEKKFAFPGVTLYNLEDKAELNPQNLAKLARRPTQAAWSSSITVCGCCRTWQTICPKTGSSTSASPPPTALPH